MELGALQMSGSRAFFTTGEERWEAGDIKGCDAAAAAAAATPAVAVFDAIFDATDTFCNAADAICGIASSVEACGDYKCRRNTPPLPDDAGMLWQLLLVSCYQMVWQFIQDLVVVEQIATEVFCPAHLSHKSLFGLRMMVRQSHCNRKHKSLYT